MTRNRGIDGFIPPMPISYKKHALADAFALDQAAPGTVSRLIVYDAKGLDLIVDAPPGATELKHGTLSAATVTALTGKALSGAFYSLSDSDPSMFLYTKIAFTPTFIVTP